MKPNKSCIQTDKGSRGAVLIKLTVEKSYLLVSFLTHIFNVLIPAEAACDPNTNCMVFVGIDNPKGFVGYLDGYNQSSG